MAIKKKLTLLLVFSFLTGGTFALAQSQLSPLWKGLEKGIHNVGFTTLNLIDNSRQVELDSVLIDRPIQISMWYPSQKGTQKMTMNSYFVNFALYRDLKKVQNDSLVDWARKTTVKYIFTKTTNDSLAIDQLFQIPAEAYLNSPKEVGKFPVIFLMANVSTDLFLLAEYLASHGYVVISKYADGLIADQWNGWSGLANSVNNDLIDINLISNYLSREAFIDFQNVALIGYHGAIESLILYQLENKNVKAVVSLDGAEVWSFNPAHKQTINNHPAWNPSKVNSPYLRIQSNLDSGNSMDMKHADWWFYKASTNPTTFVTIEDLNHYDFMSFLNGNHIVPGLTGTKNKYPTIAHKAICNYTLHFFNVHVKHSSRSKTWLQNSPHENGFPAHLIKIDSRLSFDLK